MIQRNFVPGDEWVFVKYYGGPVYLEKFLIKELFPCIENLLSADVIDKWFFVRYDDSGYHLRLRLHLKNLNNLGRVLIALKDIVRPHADWNLIYKVQFDTYSRELERYGHESMPLVEDFFFKDSQLVSKLIKILSGSEDKENTRWLCALYVLNFQLELLGFRGEPKIAFLDLLKRSYGSGFSSDSAFRKQVSLKFRTYRPVIEKFFQTPNFLDSDSSVVGLINDYQQDCSHIVDQIMRVVRHNDIFLFSSIANGLIHMSMNRFFRTKPNLNEVVCYDLLSLYEKSQAAVAKKKNRGNVVE